MAKAFDAGGDLTDLQKQEAWKAFDGKWVNWSANVTSVDKTLGSLSVQVRCLKSTFVSDAIISFDASAQPALLKLKKNQKIQFTGRLRDYNQMLGLSVADGQLVQ